jgi:TRAP-type C4-dicarboxylate transport system permease large subunit
MGWRAVFEVLVDTAVTTASLFAVLIGALIFANFVNETAMTSVLAAMISAGGLRPYGVLLVIVAIYLVLGCVFESLSMLLLTVPVFSELIMKLNFGMSHADTMVWFGIIVVMVTEISLITPPIGMNVFTLSAMLPDVSTTAIFKGVTPFWIADIIRLLLIIFIPTISLLIPSLL